MRSSCSITASLSSAARITSCSKPTASMPACGTASARQRKRAKNWRGRRKRRTPWKSTSSPRLRNSPPTPPSDHYAGTQARDVTSTARRQTRFALSPCGKGWLGRRSSRETGMSLTHAKRLRVRMTDAERRLWYRVRAHRFGAKFKRQVPLGRFVVDFVCFDHKIIIEVDGGQPNENPSDILRDQWLRSQGFQVLRFWNNDVLKNTDVVLGEVLKTLSSAEIRSPSPDALRASPSPTGGEGKEGSP